MGKKYERIDDEDDVMLMMDFRQEHWSEWVKFCHENGYEAKVRQ